MGLPWLPGAGYREKSGPCSKAPGSENHSLVGGVCSGRWGHRLRVGLPEPWAEHAHGHGPACEALQGHACPGEPQTWRRLPSAPETRNKSPPRAPSRSPVLTTVLCSRGEQGEGHSLLFPRGHGWLGVRGGPSPPGRPGALTAAAAAAPFPSPHGNLTLLGARAECWLRQNIQIFSFTSPWRTETQKPAGPPANYYS